MEFDQHTYWFFRIRTVSRKLRAGKCHLLMPESISKSSGIVVSTTTKVMEVWEKAVFWPISASQYLNHCAKTVFCNKYFRPFNVR